MPPQLSLLKRIQSFAGARRLEPMQKLKDDHGVIIFKLDVSDLESVKNAKNSLNQKLAQIIWTSYTTMLVNRVLSCHRCY